MSKNENLNKRLPANIQDITGKRYGDLTAICDTGESKNRSRVWLLKCDCGNTVKETVKDLNRGAKLSCGCRRKRPPRDSHSINNNMHYVDGTCIEHIQSIQKRPVNNQTGYRGVTKRKDGKYVAYIGFCKKRVFLGTYSTAADAGAARLRAEEDLCIPLLEKYYAECEIGNGAK